MFVEVASPTSYQMRCYLTTPEYLQATLGDEPADWQAETVPNL